MKYGSRDNRACGRPSARQTGRTRQAPRMSDPRFCTPGKARRSATRHLELKSNPSATVNFGIARRPHLKLDVCRFAVAGGSCTTQNLVWRSRQVKTRQETPTQKKKSELSTIAGYVARVGRTTERLVDTDEVHSSRCHCDSLSQ